MQLLNVADIENTVEHHLARFNKKTNKLYIASLIFVFTALLMLFVLRTDISVQATGILRPHLEKVKLSLNQSAYLKKTYIYNAKRVQIGDLLLEFESEQAEEEKKILLKRKSDIKAWVSDLDLLQKGETKKNFNSLQFSSVKNSYQTELNFYRNRVRFLSALLKKKKVAFQKGLIAKDELLNAEETLSEMADKKRSFIDLNNKTWHEQKNSFKQEQDEIESKLKSIELRQRSDRFFAPFSGTLEAVLPMSEGQYVSAGQFAVLSPDSGLVAENYVAGKDIGLINKGMPVRIQIDAFNYNHWGFVEGEVESISDDFVKIDNQLMFKVRCRLKRKELYLKNGVVGKLSKGMTVRARYIVANRKLSQLIFDNLSDWLNPLDEK